MQLQSSDYNIKIKIAIALFTTNFFFELETVSLLKSKYYKCRDFVCCRNNNQIIIVVFFQLLELYLELSINTTTLEKVLQDNICKTY